MCNSFTVTAAAVIWVKVQRQRQHQRQLRRHRRYYLTQRHKDKCRTYCSRLNLGYFDHSVCFSLTRVDHLFCFVLFLCTLNLFMDQYKKKTTNTNFKFHSIKSKMKFVHENLLIFICTHRCKLFYRNE